MSGVRAAAGGLGALAGGGGVSGGVLIANRGEVVVRVARACAELGLRVVAVHASDDAASGHVRAADATVALPGTGPRAYLDAQALIDAALQTGCTLVHPGYGFLAENAEFARAAAAAGPTFVGPSVETLALFGDKVRARALARSVGVPVLAGTDGVAALEEAQAFVAGLPDGAAVMIKAAAGGGGRGMRPVVGSEALAAAWHACAAEAKGAFGEDALYVEALLPNARHIEVQLVGDGAEVVHLWERECSVQRRRQKLIELAPAPNLDAATRDALCEAAVRLGRAAGLRSLATVEFLLGADGEFVFMEANPRLQVEHTVTEEVTGVDLVQVQLRLAAGATLADLGLTSPPPVAGGAIQLRINAETLTPEGEARPAAGVLSAFDPPGGRGVRLETHAYGGYPVSGAYDPLLAKLVVRGADLETTTRRAARALGEFRIEGVATGAPLLAAVLARPEFLNGTATTTFVEDHWAELVADAPEAAPQAPTAVAPPGTEPVAAPISGLLVSREAAVGQRVGAGALIAVIEALKMQHEVRAPAGGVVHAFAAQPGTVVAEGAPIAFLQPADVAADEAASAAVDPEHIRADLADVIARHAFTLDENRPEAVAKRRKTGHRTARENLDDLFDPGSFIEYGALAVAAQRRRRKLDDLIANTPADGLVTGLGAVNAALFGDEAARCVGLAYDYTVLAGTQGYWNHQKTDRMIAVAEDVKLPIVFYCEGGGGRPGDVDSPHVSGLTTTSFEGLARLSGTVPRIGIAAGRCFAGNAVFWGVSDICVATKDSNIGLGGPAMIEGGGLGVFRPDEIGPAQVQAANGVIDILAENEADATRLSKQALGYFQGALKDWSEPDQRRLRHLIPENRLRVYDVRQVIAGLADEGSVLELRAGYGVGIVTAFVRLEGRPVGLIANNPLHLGGAIDGDAADKAARFMQLCDAYGLPIVSLVDTPGFMVGPDSEKTAAVRRGSRLFVTAATMSVPLFAVVLRKGYGLGAQAMTRGSFNASTFTIAWPTGEFGGMGLEGAVRLGYRKELEAIADPEERQRYFEGRVAASYQAGKATNIAQNLEIDAVIDPAETRRWLVRGLKSIGPAPRGGPKRRTFVDTW